MSNHSTIQGYHILVTLGGDVKNMVLISQAEAAAILGLAPLQCRLNRDLRDRVQPDEGSDFPLSDGLPPERHFTTPDKGSV
jgi:hypothetical protein